MTEELKKLDKKFKDFENGACMNEYPLSSYYRYSDWNELCNSLESHTGYVIRELTKVLTQIVRELRVLDGMLQAHKERRRLDEEMLKRSWDS